MSARRPPHNLEAEASVLDPLARVDDGGASGLGGAGGSTADAVRALGNAVVVRCAQLVGEYVRERFAF
jgi:hypothetical protein